MVIRNISRLGMPAAALVVMTLSACQEPEVILPGAREDIRPAEDSETVETSGSKPISLPAQSQNANWSQSPGTSAFRTSNPALSATPRQIWSASIGRGDSRKQRITADPVVAGGLIYTLDSAATVSAVSTAGQVAWSTDLIPATDKEAEATGGGLAYADGVLYVSSGFGRLTALDAKTGVVKWQKKLSATGSGAPLVSDGLLYLVAGDDTGWAVDAKDGRIAWQIEATPSVGNVLGAPAPVLGIGPGGFCIWFGRYRGDVPQGRHSPLERIGRRGASRARFGPDRGRHRRADCVGQHDLYRQPFRPDRRL